MASPIKIFSGGMNKDKNPLNQPDGTYVDALDIIQSSQDGDSYSIVNEKGTSPILDFTSGMSVIGHVILDDDIIIFSTNVTNGEIGVVDTKTNIYTAILNDPGFSFSIAHQIEAVARIRFDGHRVVYFTDDFNPPRLFDIDNPPDIADLANNLSLNPRFDIPIVTEFSFNQSTVESITVGTYMFVARYTDSNLTPTIFGMVSNPIPVISELLAPQGVNWRDYDGAAFGTITNKTINIKIENIDTDLSFIEIAVLKYDTEDLLASPSPHIFERTEILGSTMNFVYDDSKTAEPAASVTLSDIIAPGNGYIRAKCIEQKDNRLFLGNLASNLDLDFQDIANNIVVSYFIRGEETSHKAPLTDYRKERLTFDKKTYTRDEIYDFAIVFLYKTGNYSFAFHIPAPVVSGTTPGKYANSAWPIDNQYVNLYYDSPSYPLGTYLSSEIYPTGVGYPTGNQRFHLIPALRNEPTFITDVAGGSRPKIRVLGLEFTNIIIPDIIQEKIDGYLIVRQRRDTTQKRSIASQGVIIDSSIMGDGKSEFSLTGSGDFNYGGWGHRQPSVLFGHTDVQSQSVADSDIVGGNRGNGIIWNDALVKPGPGHPFPRDKRLFTFYSPETAFKNLSSDTADKSPRLDVTTFDSIQAVLQVDSDGVNKKEADNSYAIKDNSTSEGGYGYHHWLARYKKYLSIVPKPIRKIDGKLWMAPSRQDSAGFNLTDYFPTIYTDNERYSNYDNFESLLLHTEDDLDQPLYTDALVEFSAAKTTDSEPNPLTGYAGHIYLNPDGDECGAQVVYDENSHKYLYNLLNTSDDIYGKITDAEYVYMNHTTNVEDQSIKCFGGDTFISEVAVRNWTRIGFIQCRHNYNTLNPIQGWSGVCWPLAPSRYYGDTGNPLRGHEFRAIMSFFVESTINTNYRHKVYASGGEFYPNSIQVSGTNNLYDPESITKGVNGYNFLYSKENTARLFYSKPLAFKQVGEFPTRIAYSDLAIIGEQQDNYKRFAVFSYHDLPKHTGEINKLFILNNIMYGHTAKSLWRCFVNDIALVQSTLDTNLVLGSGGLFDQPSKEISTIEGGYAGTVSQWAHIGTPYGRFFIDLNQKKVFLFSEQLQEVSYNGMWKYFLESMEIKDDDVEDIDNKDNPANPANGGYISGYDYKNKRFVLTKRIKASTDGKRSTYNSVPSVTDPFKPFSNISQPIPIGTVDIEMPVGIDLSFFVGKETINLCYYDNILSQDVCVEYDIVSISGNIFTVSEYPSESYKAKIDCWDGSPYDSNFATNGGLGFGEESAIGWSFNNWAVNPTANCKTLDHLNPQYGGVGVGDDIISPIILEVGRSYHIEIWINNIPSGVIGAPLDVNTGSQGMSIISPAITPINGSYGYYQDTTITYSGGDGKIRIEPYAGLGGSVRIIAVRCTDVTNKKLSDVVNFGETIKIRGIGKSEGGFNVSYSPVSNSWISFHSWKPNVIISKGDRFFSIHNDATIGAYKLWEHDKGKYGDFYSSFVGISKSSILFIINNDPSVTKVFDNMILHTQSLNEVTGVYQLDDTFDTFQMYNEYQNTGEILLNGNVKHKEDKYYVVVPRDTVIDTSVSIFEPTNLDSSKDFRQRMRSKFVFVKYTYNNQNDFRLIMNAINAIFRKSYR